MVSFVRSAVARFLTVALALSLILMILLALIVLGLQHQSAKEFLERQGYHDIRLYTEPVLSCPNEATPLKYTAVSMQGEPKSGLLCVHDLVDVWEVEFPKVPPGNE